VFVTSVERGIRFYLLLLLLLLRMLRAVSESRHTTDRDARSTYRLFALLR